MRAGPQLLIFGLDGAGFGLTEWMMRRGLLPNLAKFKDDAGMVPLVSTWPPHTAPAWPTIFNGRMPGGHGIYMFWDCQSADYRLRVMRRGEAGVDSIFDFLPRRGITVGLQNIPMFHPATGLESYQIGWPLENTLHYIHPPRLARELPQAGGLVRPDISCMYDGTYGYPWRAMAYIRQRGNNLRYLFKKHPVDVAAVVFTELDRVGHHYWHGMDAAHPKFGACSIPDAIVDTYRTLDAVFGETLALVGDECAIAVVSDHGMGPGTTGVGIHHLLEEGGFLNFLGQKPNAGERTALDELTDITDLRKTVCFEKTLAYMPVPGSFALNLNMKNRQELGIVSRDDEKAVLGDISAYLMGRRGPDGKPLFRAVIKADEIYAGPFRTKAPDLLLVPCDAACMLLMDCNEVFPEPIKQTGLHRMEGVFMLRSPRLGRIVDGAPIGGETVANLLLASLGIEDDAFPDMRTMDRQRTCAERELLAGAWFEGPIEDGRYRYEKPAALAMDAVADRGNEEWIEIGERLRRMGYL